MSVTRRVSASLLAMVALFVGAIAFAGVASAYPAGVNPQIALSSSTAAEGSSLTVSGANFVPNEGITIELHSAVSTVGSATADSKGAFSASITLTAGVTGAHTIVAIGASGDSASAPIVITTGSGSGSGSGSGNGGGGLSSTGVAVLGIGSVGVVLLVGGGLMLLAGRRRKALV